MPLYGLQRNIHYAPNKLLLMYKERWSGVQTKVQVKRLYVHCYIQVYYCTISYQDRQNRNRFNGLPEDKSCCLLCDLRLII